jgi:hypothetical protein
MEPGREASPTRRLGLVFIPLTTQPEQKLSAESEYRSYIPLKKSLKLIPKYLDSASNVLKGKS